MYYRYLHFYDVCFWKFLTKEYILILFFFTSTYEISIEKFKCFYSMLNDLYMLNMNKYSCFMGREEILSLHWYSKVAHFRFTIVLFF